MKWTLLILLSLPALVLAQEWQEVMVDETYLSPSAIRLVDIDGDGDLDLVAGSSATGPLLSWWENDGNAGGWAEHAVYPMPYPVVDLEAGDLNGDGETDVVCVVTGPEAGVIWHQNVDNGTGWTHHFVQQAWYTQHDLELGDVDGDGDLDIVGATMDGPITWWENDAGTGLSWTVHALMTQPQDMDAIELADLDGDATLDIAAVSSASDEIWTLRNVQGGGVNWSSTMVEDAYTDPEGLVIDDFNLDGHLDLFVLSHYTYGNKAILLNLNGDGHSFSERHPFGSGIPGDVPVIKSGDLDGDGDPDVVDPWRLNELARWLENMNGQGTQWIERDFGDDDPSWVVDLDVGDVDGNGLGDVVYASAGLHDLAIRLHVPGPETITVLTPVAGEINPWNTTVDINWEDNFPWYVRIDLLQNGQQVQNLTMSTPSDGYFEWDVPWEYPQGDDYAIKVSNVTNLTIYDISDEFSITSGGTIDVTSPAEGDLWPIGSTQEILWTDNFPYNVKILLLLNGSVTHVIAESTPSDGSYLWEVSDNVGYNNDYNIRIEHVESEEIAGTSGTFNIILPEVTLLAPNGGEVFQWGETTTIQWTDNGIQEVSLACFNNDEFIDWIATQIPSTGQYTWTLPTYAPGDNFKVRVSAYPLAEDFSDDYFTVVETTDPFITVVSPNGGEVWQMGTQHEIAWEDNIDDPVTIRLYREGLNVLTIAGNTPSDGSYQWTIPTNLVANNEYSVKITPLGQTEPFDWSDNNFEITAATAPVQVTLTPTGSTEIPSGGGTLNYSVHVVNNTGNSYQNVQYWTKILLPNGNWYNQILFQQSFTMPAGLNTTANLFQNIPAMAPAGGYEHWGWVGQNPNYGPSFGDGFEFTKTP